MEKKASCILPVLFLIAVFATAQTSLQAPTITLINVDDLGWADLACYGNRYDELSFPETFQIGKKGNISIYVLSPFKLPVHTCGQTKG